MTHTPDPGPDAELPAPAPLTPKAIAYGLLWLAVPLAVIVLCAMAAGSAAATGGCGGG